jgi:hypothetical protein
MVDTMSSSDVEAIAHGGFGVASTMRFLIGQPGAFIAALFRGVWR